MEPCWTPNVVDRATCRLRLPSRPLTMAGLSEGLMVHCTDGRIPSDEKDAMAAWRATQDTHQLGNGWKDVAYSFGFNDLGQVLEGRGWRAVCSAAKGHNTRLRHVVYQGKGKSPTPQALAALAWLIAQHDALYPGGMVIGHRDVNPHKLCPGPGLYAAIVNAYGHRNPFLHT